MGLWVTLPAPAVAWLLGHSHGVMGKGLRDAVKMALGDCLRDHPSLELPVTLSLYS